MGSRLERAFRDVHVITQHMAGSTMRYEQAGASYWAWSRVPAKYTVVSSHSLVVTLGAGSSAVRLCRLLTRWPEALDGSALHQNPAKGMYGSDGVAWSQHCPSSTRASPVPALPGRAERMPGACVPKRAIARICRRCHEPQLPRVYQAFTWSG